MESLLTVMKVIDICFFYWLLFDCPWFQVSALPKNARVEIEAIAVLGEIIDLEIYW
jgi:hypothetical protein